MGGAPVDGFAADFLAVGKPDGTALEEADEGRAARTLVFHGQGLFARAIDAVAVAAVGAGAGFAGFPPGAGAWVVFQEEKGGGSHDQKGEEDSGSKTAGGDGGRGGGGRLCGGGGCGSCSSGG